jgi:hypothetical protein
VESSHGENIAIWRQRLSDLCEFEAILLDRVSSRTARATKRNTASKKAKKKKKKKKKNFHCFLGTRYSPVCFKGEMN